MSLPSLSRDAINGAPSHRTATKLAGIRRTLTQQSFLGKYGFSECSTWNLSKLVEAPGWEKFRIGPLAINASNKLSRRGMWMAVQSRTTMLHPGTQIGFGRRRSGCGRKELLICQPARPRTCL